ncbi:MAG: hypothetical protein K8S15_06450 [Candidatus Aegiribacteria sp.]|nr:hypothetical protein [Candidatus Aegiribacteria sp.]
MKRYLSPGIFLTAVLLAAMAGCTQYTSVTTETHSIPENSVVEVSTFNGSITVEWYEGSDLFLEVTITANSEAELAEAEVDITAGALTGIEAYKLDDDARVGVSLLLRLPHGVEIAELHTSNGRITVSGGSGFAQATTSNGSISFENFSGSVRAETSNGSVTVSGSDLVYARSSNGSITGEIMSIPPEGIELRTSNGAINVELNSSLDADIEMNTSNGSVSVTGEGFSSVIIDDSDGTAILGAGGNSITLRTSNGSIRIKAVTP